MTQLAVLDSGSNALTRNFDRAAALAEAAERYGALIEFYKGQMKEGLDYAKIPGTDKPSLLQPGADKLCALFGLTTTLEITEATKDWIGKDTYGEPFFSFSYRCRIYRTGTDILLGEADGSCSSFERGFRYRNAKPSCPECGQETIFKSKKEKGGGWFCWAKHGGCGAEFNAGDPAITNQEVGQVKNPDIFDLVHPIQMRAQKRAKVAAVRTVTCSSEFFTQDMEELTIPVYRSSEPTKSAEPPASSKPAPAPAKGKVMTNADKLVQLLDKYRITDAEVRKGIAQKYLKGRKAGELKPSEFAKVLLDIESALTTTTEPAPTQATQQPSEEPEDSLWDGVEG